MSTESVHSDPVVRQIQPSDLETWCELREMLWPGESSDQECTEILTAIEDQTPDRAVAVVFVACLGKQAQAIGFLEGSIRSHVDGCQPGRVAYIEGWLVHPSYQHRGIGRALVDAFEEWARQEKCEELGSDALIDNQNSESAHLALGFEVVDRCVNFRKSL